MNHKCPCCGYYTYPVPQKDDIGFICPVCFWENDVFLTSENDHSSCNHGITLQEAKDNYKEFGACEYQMLCHVRKPRKDEYNGFD